MKLAVQLGNLLFGLARKFVVAQILGHCRLAVQLGNLLFGNLLFWVCKYMTFTAELGARWW